MAKIIKGFFFDLDGTLVNTHEANFYAYKQAVRETMSQDLGQELKVKIKQGESSDNFLPTLVSGIGTDQLSAIQKKKKEVYPKHLHMSEVNEFLSSFLAQMSQHYVTVLVTTAKKESAEAVIATHNIAQYFDFCIFGEDVKQAKPSPEAYNLALERAKLHPDEVIAFEDSEKGVQAALSAGIQTVQIRSFYDA